MKEAEQLFTKVRKAWHEGNARNFATCFANDGTLIAFDGTFVKGKQAIFTYAQRLFAAEEDQTYQSVLVETQLLTANVVLMRCHTGKIKRETGRISRERLAYLTLIMQKKAVWEVVLMQYTPAHFDTPGQRTVFRYELEESLD